ncbi:MAG: flagellar biosynthesis protein FliQ [Candidatus Sericytochromatia bacterium]|nr:flagellar biosynthesis protein FliQ [Candidatus Sericytochromatia bacterium]
MSDTTVIHVVSQAIIFVLLLSAPIVLTSLVVGFIVALLQTITSIQEQTLSFVPKTLAVFGVILAVGPWLMATMVGYINRLWSSIPDLLAR